MEDCKRKCVKSIRDGDKNVRLSEVKEGNLTCIQQFPLSQISRNHPMVSERRRHIMHLYMSVCIRTLFFCDM